MNKIEKAEKFARLAHDGQIRKYNGRPYIEHPACVARRVEEFSGENHIVVAAAWLHDTLEDCNVSNQDLIENFGLEVFDLVYSLTNPSINFPRLRRAERKRMDREHLAKCNEAVQLIKVVDRLDNLDEMTGADPSFEVLYKHESLLLADCLTKAPTVLLEELRKSCL